MRRLLRFAPLFAAVAPLACVTTAQEGQQMRADIADVRAQQQADRDKVAQEKKQLQEALDQLNRAARKSGADLAVDLEKAQNDLAAIRGQLEVLQHRMDQLEKTSQQHQQQLDETSRYIAGRQKEQERAEHPTDRMGIYNLARQKLEQGQTARARELLQEFLQKFPKDELASNAQYWMGESYYGERKWDDAIVEFQKVLKQYKGSEKVADAVLKIGMSFQAQGDCQNATLFFDEVQQSHRGTEAARLAKEHTAECRKKGTTKTGAKAGAKTGRR